MHTICSALYVHNCFDLSAHINKVHTCTSSTACAKTFAQDAPECFITYMALNNRHKITSWPRQKSGQCTRPDSDPQSHLQRPMLPARSCNHCPMLMNHTDCSPNTNRTPREGTWWLLPACPSAGLCKSAEWDFKLLLYNVCMYEWRVMQVN